MQSPFNPVAFNANGNKPEKRLQQIYKDLPDEQQQQLLDYAEYLAERHPPQQPESTEVVEIARPEEESVVEAIKRLSKSYHMIDRSKMLHETAGLMTQHMMQGREAAEVIDDLEALFKRYYQEQFGQNQES